MAMTGGSCTITANADGSATVSGTGLATAMAVARMTSIQTRWMATASTYSGTLPTGLLATYQTICTNTEGDVNLEAAAIVGYIQGNAELTGNAVIGTGLGGLQRSTAAGSLTDPIGGIIATGIPLTGGVN